MAADYFPLKKGHTLEYHSVGDQGPTRFTDEILSVATANGKTVANVRKTIQPPGGTPEVREFKITRDAKGVYEYGEKQLPFPIAVGKKWDISPREYEIVSMNQTVVVPAGTFEDCVKIIYLVAGGDAGSGEIYYAPGVGRVRYVCAEEDDSYEIALARFSSGNGA